MSYPPRSSFQESASASSLTSSAVIKRFSEGALLSGIIVRACQADPEKFFVILAKAGIHFDFAAFSGV
ncbi:MAG: hypothetical protein WBP11_14355 [Dokdonella sp.]